MKVCYSNLKVIALVTILAVILAGCATQSAHYRIDPALQRSVVALGGYQYVPLNKLCSVYGINYQYDAYIWTATVRKGANSAVIRAGSDRALVNGVERRLDRPAMVDGGVVYVPLSFARTGLAPMMTYADVPQAVVMPKPEPPKRFTIRTIVLDTGHGGKDVGAVGRRIRLKEKDVALAVSRRVKQELEAQGIRVIMTRSDDTFIPLPKRVDIANASDADLFVSIHINASTSRTLSGFECYYLSTATDDRARALEAAEDASLELSEGAAAARSAQLDKTLWDMTLAENRRESGELASFICSSVDKSLLIRNRGIRAARFYVLKNTRMPSVLVETAYISNKLEEEKLRDQKFIDGMADAIAAGILRYKSEYERTEGFTKT